ncbi:hypothetical protein ABFA07_013729 [Porites harrisoni]
METRKLNSNAEKAVDIPMGRRQSLPRNLEDELRRAAELKPAKTTAYLDIQVYSSKGNASVVVNGKLVSEVTAENRQGINVVVLNQGTGDVMAVRGFDTYSSKADSKQLINFINSLAEGRVLCFAVRDEATASLMIYARSFIRKLGSSFINQLGWRDMWAFVAQRINNEKFVYAEGFQHSAIEHDWAPPVTIHTTVPLRPESVVKCSWEDNEENHRRREFCDTFDGYTGICNCNNPESIAFEPPPLPDGTRIELPVLVMASNRPQYLFRMLKTLREVQGLMPSMVTVFIDGFFDEPAYVARMFGLKVDQHEPISEKNARIAQHYKKSLTASFARYPDANYLVILEEDLDISPDILTYFQQLLPVLEKDESLYCISAWNDQGYAHTAKDPAMMYRVETMPGLGWVLSRKLYKGELEPVWPGPNVFWDWDMWMRDNEMRKNRECIIPDVSRTYHFGATGLNMNPFMQHHYFTKHALNDKRNVKLNVDIMYKDSYEKELGRLIREAEVLDHSKNPCKNRNDFVPSTKDKTYIFYIRMDHASDWITWFNIARCLKIWDLDARGFHKSLWRLWLNESHVLIVGCPASPHCAHKSSDVIPIDIQNKVTRPPD